MSLLEIKQQVSRLSAAERRELNAYLLRLRNESPEGRELLTKRMRSMDAGAKISDEVLADRLARKDGDAL
jgi:hypothetical protein